MMHTTIRRLNHSLCKALLVLALAACVPSHKAKLPEREPDVTGPFSEVAQLFGQMQEQLANQTETTAAPAAMRDLRVGLLLPLSGASSEIGKHMQDAASLAVFDAKLDSTAPTSITLIPKDTSTSATIAAQAAQEVMAQGASRIVGPVFSQSVAEVGKLAAARGVTVIALTNNRQVAAAGVNVFGFTPEDQVTGVVNYALKSGASHLALLAPNDAYGTVAEAAFKASVAAKGGLVTTVERYGKKPEHRSSAAKRIMESYRASPFKALMVADSPQATADLIRDLKAEGLATETVQLLGTALLDEAGARPDPNLFGVVYATTNPGNYNAFQRRFEATYGYTPKRIASLAYDAVRLSAEPAVQGDYTGRATGAFRITPEGITQRSLAIVAVSATGFNVVKPAAREFEK